LLTGIIFDLKKYALHDGPGIRTTVFFKGCPLRCLWCHNPESQSFKLELIFRASRCILCEACLARCAAGAITRVSAGDDAGGDVMVTDPGKCKVCGQCVDECYAEARQLAGREVMVADVMAEIERDVAYYDQSGGGVTFSGGEPLAQPEFLLALLRACRDHGIHTALDTSGFAQWKVLDDIRPYVNLFLYDLKVMDSAKHRRFTGAPNDLILSNLRALSEAGHNLIIRVPIIPGLNDRDDDLRQLGAFAAALPHLRRIDLLSYHEIAIHKYERLDKAYVLTDVRPPSTERMTVIANGLRSYGLAVKTYA
jgi:pyruvate formate lyase activating enzyme